MRLINPVCLAALVALTSSVALAQTPIHSYTFNTPGVVDTGSVGGADGTLRGASSVSGGSLILPGARPSNDPTTMDIVTFDPAAIALETMDAFSFEFWATPSSTMTNYHALWAYGDNNTASNGNGPAAEHFVNIQSHRANPDGSGAAISLPASTQPWTVESIATGPELNDDAEHHYVATYREPDPNVFGDVGTVSWYVDGALANTTNLSAGNSDFSQIVPGFARLGLGYGWDPVWVGSMNEFNIYGSALSANEVGALYAAGPVPVPEPASLALLGLGGLLAFRRRR